MITFQTSPLYQVNEISTFQLKNISTMLHPRKKSTVTELVVCQFTEKITMSDMQNVTVSDKHTFYRCMIYETIKK